MIDAWSGPAPVSNQFPANEPNGIRKLLDKIAALERQIRESTSNLLGTAGIRLTQLGMFIDSSLTVGGSLDVTGPMVVDGSETVNGPLAVHGTADFDGATSIGGTLTVVGTLSLPAGIINNDALTSPVASQVIYGMSTSFGLTTSWVTQCSTTITVPAGFTSCVVSVSARGFATNPNTTGGSNSAGGDFFYVRAVIGGSHGIGFPTRVLGSGDSVSVVGPFSCVISGLTSGGTFTVTCDVTTMFLSWATNANNTAEVSGSILWFR